MGYIQGADRNQVVLLCNGKLKLDTKGCILGQSMIDADTFVEHFNGPGAVVEHAIHIEKNHFVHCQISFRCRVDILLHR